MKAAFFGLLLATLFLCSCQSHYIDPASSLTCTKYTIPANRHKDPSLDRSLPKGTDSITARITFIGDLRYSSCQIGEIDDIRDVSKAIGLIEASGWRGPKYKFGPTHAIRFGWQTDTLAEEGRVARAMAYANHPGGKHPFVTLKDPLGRELYLRSGQEYQVAVVARGAEYRVDVATSGHTFSASIPRMFMGPSNPKLALPWIGGDDALDHTLTIRVCRKVD